MNYISYIESLKATDFPMELQNINNWLKLYKKEFQKIISISKCGKWQKYINNGETPYPCCCSIKDESCQFAEFYYCLNNEASKDEPDLFYIKNYINRTLSNLKNLKQ